MRSNFTTATRARMPSEHSGIIAAQLMGVPYVGPHVAQINAVPVPFIKPGSLGLSK